MSGFHMPSLGADMEEATLTQWLVKPGDNVKRGDVVAVVETTKRAIEIEVFEDGKVGQLLVPEGEKVPVGALLTEIITASDKAPAGGEQRKPENHGDAPSARRTRASPAARKRAAELNLDLEDIQGSGPDGAVTLADIESVESREPVETSAKTAERFDKNAMRQTIAAAMARSKREIPHYYLATAIDMQRALSWLRDYNRDRDIAERLSYLTLTVKAIALALRKVPELNGFYNNNAFTPADDINIGMAISLRGGGLIAPALSQVDKKSLEDIGNDLGDLVERARRGSLTAMEISAPTITVSNMGERGVETLYGVITPPQVALVGLGKVIEKPLAENGEIVIRPQMRVTLSADHRASDGHRGAIFLNNIDQLLQKPEQL